MKVNTLEEPLSECDNNAFRTAAWKLAGENYEYIWRRPCTRERTMLVRCRLLGNPPTAGARPQEALHKKPSPDRLLDIARPLGRGRQTLSAASDLLLLHERGPRSASPAGRRSEGTRASPEKESSPSRARRCRRTAPVYCGERASGERTVRGMSQS